MNRLSKGLITGLATGLCGLLLSLVPVGSQLELGIGLNSLYRLRGAAPAPESVAIVAIDERTGERIGQPALLREWPRSIHAKLVDRLTQLGAAAIVFDIDFERPKSSEDDVVLQRSIATSNRVLLVEKLTGKKQPVTDPNGNETVVWIEQLIPPLSMFSEAARALAPFPVPKTEAAVYDFWAFKPSIGDVATMPAAALQIQAQRAHQHLLKLLAAGSAGKSVPDDTTRLDTQALMRTVRQAYLKHPTLAHEVTAQFANSDRHALTLNEQQQLRLLNDLYGGPDHRRLNFYGPPGTIKTIPYHKLLMQDDQANIAALPDLRNKVVFVGFSDLFSPGQIDRFYTVFSTEDGVDLSGVEIAATAFANLASGNGLRTPGIYESLALLGLFGSVLGVVTYVLPASRSIPLALSGAGVYAYGAYYAFTYTNLWLPLAIPLLVQLPMALFLSLMGQYLLERTEKERATKAIGYYLPEHVAADLARGRIDAASINKVVYSTCFASDMAGFTTIAEQKDPNELAVFLNDYFDTVSKPLKQHGVDVTEFRADGIMCAWTAPHEDLNIRRKAVSAALDTVKAVSQFKDRHALSWQPLRIGLEVGNVYVGHAGGGGRFVYSIVGDCANTAARIEGLNKQLGTRLLATQAVISGVEGLLVRPVGDFQFVGKSSPSSIVEILGWYATASDADRQLAERFKTALDSLASADVADARRQFEGIQNDYPADGPCRFYISRCDRYLGGSEFSYVVHLQQK